MKTDLNYLRTMSGDNQELISEMIDIFNSQVIEFSADMQNLLNKKDYDSLGKLAHKAKSSVAIMGMNDLSTSLKELEINTKNVARVESYQGYINFFKTECTQACIELLDYKNKIN